MCFVRFLSVCLFVFASHSSWSSGIIQELYTYNGCPQYLETVPSFNKDKQPLVDSWTQQVSASLRTELKALRDQSQNQTQDLDDGLPMELLPIDYEMAHIAFLANYLLGDEDSMISFVNRFYRRVLEVTFTFDPEFNLSSSNGLIVNAKGAGVRVVHEMAKEQGWDQIAIVNDQSSSRHFDRKVLLQGSIFYDLAAYGSSHAASAHLFQILMITPHIEKRFGKGATKRFIRFMGTEEGHGLWHFIFHRDQDYFSDFRTPRTFNILRLMSSMPSSYLGLD